MVFENLLKVRLVEKKPGVAFLIGFFFSIIGYYSAKLVFPKGLGYMSVAFISVLLVPMLSKLLRDEENVEIREKKFNLKQLFIDHRDIFEIYIFLFIGIFFFFFYIGSFTDLSVISKYFTAQLNAAGLTGKAFDSTFFLSILKNNMIVFLACLILSLVYGAGSILFLTWNASVWGIVFGLFANKSFHMLNPILSYFTFMLPFLPHFFVETFAYVFSAIVGGVMSKGLLREKFGSEKFNHVFSDGLILSVFGILFVVFGAFLEVIFPDLNKTFMMIFYSVLFVLTIVFAFWIYFGKNHFHHHRKDLDPLLKTHYEHLVKADVNEDDIQDVLEVEKELSQSVSKDELKEIEGLIKEEKGYLTLDENGNKKKIEKKKVGKKKKNRRVSVVKERLKTSEKRKK